MLTIQDLLTMIEIIDTQAKRGGFQADEFVTVGNLRSKMITLVNETQKETESQDVVEEAEVVTTEE